MHASVEVALYSYLEKKSPLYYGKMIELHAEVERWLTYIPQTFPHYTSHTIDHSEEIILQLSHLLFENNKFTKPHIELSGVETYAICAAAYLHDSGMVASEDEKAKILASPGWKDWLGKSTNATLEVARIDALRDAQSDDPTVNAFLADVALRRLLSDYIRRLHHERSSSFAQVNQTQLGRFGFDDPALIKTISALCRGHGLSRRALDDEVDYPLQRQIRGENANVRLLAILLRLGDLLDLRSDRACPLCLSAASPLPPNSAEHWEQYSAIDQISVSSERIHLVANCSSVEQHRILADWFKWISDEISESSTLLARAKLHDNWRPPKAEFGKDLIVQPAKEAKYRPVDWQFEISLDNVLRRFTNDTYAEKGAFIRELVQNSLDASRCQIYSETAGPVSTNPALLPFDVVKPYTISVEISEQLLPNGVTAQTVTVSDRGTGMTEQTIIDHFLQIGRSFYDTEKFRKSYVFSPNSRFGIGFLSVFGSSDHVTVETRAAELLCGLRLTLTSPKSYLVVEDVVKPDRGTTITVRLSQSVQFKPGELTRYLTEWLSGIEIPVHVTDFGVETVILRETCLPDVFELSDVEKPGAAYKLRHFSFKDEAALFDIYVLVYLDPPYPENWTRSRYYENSYLNNNPHAEYADVPGTALTSAGINAEVRFPSEFGPYDRWDPAEIVDIRDGAIVPDLSRTRYRFDSERRDAVDRRDEIWIELLRQHTESWRGTDKEVRWKYLQKLAGSFWIKPEFWRQLPNSLSWYRGGKSYFSCPEKMIKLKTFGVLIHASDGWEYTPTDFETPPTKAFRTSLVVDLANYRDMRAHWSRDSLELFAENFVPESVVQVIGGWRLILFKRKDQNFKSKIIGISDKFSRRKLTWVEPLIVLKARPRLIPIFITVSHSFVLVLDRDLVQFMVRLFSLSEKKETISATAIRFFELLHDLVEVRVGNARLSAFVKGWNLIKDLPASLKVGIEIFGLDGK